MATEGVNPDGSVRHRTDMLPRQAHLTGWNTPKLPSGGGQEVRQTPGGGLRKLEDQVPLAGWTTPNATEPHAPMRPSRAATGRTTDYLGRQVQAAGWATPDAQAMNDGEQLDTWDARQAKNKAKHGNGNGAGMPIAIQCQLAGYPTPNTRDHHAQGATHNTKAQSSSLATQMEKKCPPGPARLTASGELQTGSTAGMASGGRLSPLHSLWLMLGPLALHWLKAAERVERTPKRSSTRTRSPKQAPIATE